MARENMRKVHQGCLEHDLCQQHAIRRLHLQIPAHEETCSDSNSELPCWHTME